MRSKRASLIAIFMALIVLILSLGVLGASSFGVFSPPYGTLDPEEYALPLPETKSPDPGFDDIDPSLTLDKAALQQNLMALSRTSASAFSFSVWDLQGTQLAALEPTTTRVPASSMKSLTSMAVLAAYGSNHRFPTTVVPSATGIVLVGGGDPYLTGKDRFHPWQAHINDLADQVVEKLAAQGTTSVTLGYDDSLFSGTGWAPTWLASFGADVAPITALSVDPKVSNSANTSALAANAFAAVLASKGIKVTATRSEKAPQADPLGVVKSVPLGLIVQRAMENSDNFATEVLFRHVAIAAGLAGSHQGGQQALESYLQSVGLWAPGMAVHDGSGLSLQNRVSTDVFAKAMNIALKDPQLSDVIRGLPVAGVEGTLTSRFDDAAEFPGRGVVRAKTGTHYKERSLTGIVQTQSGAVVTFSFLVEGITNHAAALNWLDRAAAILASS
ncbi:MAG: D-alanyl-D-alanine carboxypeptidase/D-alanyl-D-alanine-endopeptidase [Propionibacteriaceae bacterium]|jgi:D-alanyl-D-alanine carboxypeptidase/D-alanyl-D-alanine-endopeptidase (penicillin-binding protein 4)|nr:D-alanyl-D-alanine carboxypeptidase/D-alanyl-D-alanine-endopeptidase [Propionibacteriaceae bacterium]